MKNNKNKSGKQLSNPFSTGGGGGHFEAHAQAYFVILMLTDGHAPCLPDWPIYKIKLQTRHAEYNTDDITVFMKKSGGKQERKIFGQIKRSIGITTSNKAFGEVIQAAWDDFNNVDLFSKGKDVIALITGPLSARDISNTRIILEWAREKENAYEFVSNIELPIFSSNIMRSKLKVFRTKLEKANGGESVSDEILFEFLKHFHILSLDLDVKTGANLSLIHTLIGKFSEENVLSIWPRIVDVVQSANKNAGTISPESIPEDLQAIFKQQGREIIPEEFSKSLIPLTETKPEWNQHIYASDLVIADLLGAWNEKNEADQEVVRQLSDNDYDTWIPKIREILQLPNSPITLKNGRWNIPKRKELWKALSARLFNSNLDIFKQCIINVLTERDPQFDLPVEERYAASIHGKVLKHSSELRKGMAESLALLGSQPSLLSNCSQSKPELIAVLAIREIFNKADWVLWGSLNNLLPTLAEAAPNEFLDVVSNTLQQTPCPFGLPPL